MPDSEEENVACRICMEPKQEYVSLFIKDLSKKVMELADVQVEKSDGLPENICIQCEQDLEQCYQFRLKVQTSDKQFRQGLTFSQVNIEECRIKEENLTHDDDSDNRDDTHSVCMDEDNYNELDVPQKVNEEVDESTPNPLDHVVVVQGKEGDVESAEPISEHVDTQAESEMNPIMPKVEEFSVQPTFVCMKQEAETEIMDVECSQPDPLQPGPSSRERNAGFQDDSCRSPYAFVPLCFEIRVTPFSNLSETPIFSSASGTGDISVGFQPIDDVKSNKAPASVKHNNDEDCQLQKKQKLNSQILNEIQLHNEIQTNPMQEPCDVEAEDTSEVEQGSDSGDYGDSQASELSISSVQSLQLEAAKGSFCSVCYVECGNDELLQKHKEGKEFFCRRCVTKFDTHSELESHFFSHTSLRCKVCKEVFFFRKDLYRHAFIAKCYLKAERKYSCEHCSKKFKRPYQLTNHLLKHNMEKSTGGVCIVCKKSFKGVIHLSEHQMRCHVAYEVMECEMCAEHVLGPGKLLGHMKTKHVNLGEHAVKLPCPFCDKVWPSKNSLSQHMERHEKTPQVCEICGESVRGQKAMTWHKKSKHPRNPFQCDLCPEQFNTWSEKRNHRRQHLPRVFCEICGKSYKNSEVLNKHLETHSEEKQHQCEVCGAAFKQKVALKNHGRVHQDVGKYICQRCGQHYRWKQTFDKHVKICEGKQKSESSE